MACGAVAYLTWTICVGEGGRGEGGGRRWTQAAAGEVSGNGGLCSRGLVLGFVKVIRRQGMISDPRRVMVGLVRTCELESSLA